MSSGHKTILQRLEGKSPRTILTRGLQEANLGFMSAFNGWARLESKIRNHFRGKVLSAYIESFEKNGRQGVLASADIEKAFVRTIREGLADVEGLQAWGAAIRARQFNIFSHPVPATGPFPWTTDWRFGHVWPWRDFHSFSHHEARSVAYDVKYPWELSRLWFLPPLMQKAMLERSLGWDQGHIGEVYATLSDFDKSNPFARTINWYPMETAMRGITLVMLLDMALLAHVPQDHVELLLNMIAKHGECLWRSVEYTDNRGNHYAANIVALLVMGAALSSCYPPARKWQLYAVEHIEDEILRQFLPDGVNFEKSTAYHALVLELFLTAKIVMDRQGVPLGGEALRRLHEACLYAAAVRRPDGRAPLIGDTDDARVFALDDRPAADHATVIALGAVLFEDHTLKSALARQSMPAVLPWLTGEKGVMLYRDLPAADPFASKPALGVFFAEGGMMTVKGRSATLVMDAGEVGQNGFGGHGHNDLLSFELSVDGHPFIIDPGCPSYTGEPRVRKLFRSTGYHNTPVVDGQEMAELLGPFRIADTAKPLGAVFEEKDDGTFILLAGHTGYNGLPDPVSVHRRIEFNVTTENFLCTDRFSMAGPHKIDRYFHFSPDAVLNVKEDGVLVNLYQYRYMIRYDRYSKPYAIYGRVSNGYGHAVEAPILALATESDKPLELFIKIEKLYIGL